MYLVTLISSANNEDWWDALTYLYGQLPGLSDSGMMAYSYIFTNTTLCGTPSNCSLFFGPFLMLDPANGTFEALFAPIVAHISATWPTTVSFQGNESRYDNFYSWWFPNRDSGTYGDDILVGSRLIGGQSLAQPADQVKAALKGATGSIGYANVNMVAGKGVWNAKPAGGSNAVNPAWRKAYLHFG